MARALPHSPRGINAIRPGAAREGPLDQAGRAHQAALISSSRAEGHAAHSATRFPLPATCHAPSSHATIAARREFRGSG